MRPFPTNFAARTEPLPSNLSDEVQQDMMALEEKGYIVHTGLTEDYADAIKDMSQQPSILTYCLRDSTERFAAHGATEHWLSKGRAVFLLLKQEDDKLRLAGYGWSGREQNAHIPNGETTFALRIGEADQGHGLALPFARVLVAATETIYGAANMWLETWESNGGAVHIYHKAGFVTVAQEASLRPTPEGDSVADTRLYMTQPH